MISLQYFSSFQTVHLYFYYDWYIIYPIKNEGVI